MYVTRLNYGSENYYTIHKITAAGEGIDAVVLPVVSPVYTTSAVRHVSE
jgi:hypothetical protein